LPELLPHLNAAGTTNPTLVTARGHVMVIGARRRRRISMVSGRVRSG
jgi:hypothetical protein